MFAAAAIAALGVALILYFDEVRAILHDILAMYVKLYGTIFYMLSYVFFLIIDFLEITFKRVLGIKGTYSIVLDGNTVSSDDDLVLTVIKSSTVRNIFLALSVIALFLLIVSVIIAIIRSEYNWDKQGNSKGPIFAKALKAMALYLTVPTACMFGVWGASKLLKALDQATSQSDETFISSMIFSCAAVTGNRLQSDELWEGLKTEYEHYQKLSDCPFGSRFTAFIADGTGKENLYKQALGLTTTNDGDIKDARQTIQESVDLAFKQSYGANITTLSTDSSGKQTKVLEGVVYTTSASSVYESSHKVVGENNASMWLIRVLVPSGKRNICSPYSLTMVHFYYGLLPAAGGVGWGYNHVISLLCAFMILKVLFDITCGVLKRAYELVVLYVISPPVVAIMPLDDGAAYKGWCKAFIGKTLMAYGGVLAINFFFMLVPIFNTISIFSTADGLSPIQAAFFGGGPIAYLFDMFVRLLFVMAGAFSISSLSKMISGIIGAEDAAESGSAISGQIANTVGKVAGVAAAVATGGASLAAGGGKALMGALKPSGGDAGGGDAGGDAGGSGDTGGGTPSAPPGNGGGAAATGSDAGGGDTGGGTGGGSASGSSGGGGGGSGVAPPSKPPKSTKLQNFVKNPFKSTFGAAGKAADKGIKEGAAGLGKGLDKGITTAAGKIYGAGSKLLDKGLKATENREGDSFMKKSLKGGARGVLLADKGLNIASKAVLKTGYKGVKAVGKVGIQAAYGGIKLAGKTMGKLFGAALSQFGDGKMAENFSKTYGAVSGADKIKKDEEKAQAAYQEAREDANAQNLYASARNSAETARATTEMNKRAKQDRFKAEQKKKQEQAEAERYANQERQIAMRKARAKRNKK